MNVEEKIKEIEENINKICSVLEIHDKTLERIAEGLKEMNKLLKKIKERVEKELEDKVKYIG